MAILHQLGINHTTFYCLVIFLITFFTLKSLVFEPYFKAFEERENRTKGGEETAKEIQKKTQEVKSVFEAEARDLNTEVKSIFEQSKLHASREYSRVVTEARVRADQYIEKVREDVQAEIKKASENIKTEVPFVAQVITKKMLN